MLGSTMLAEHEIAFTTAKDISGSFIFNGLDLSDCGELSVDTSNYDDINAIDLDTYNAPRTDGGGVLGYFVRGKTLNVKMVVMKDTAEELNDTIDYLKLKLFKQEGILRIKINGKYRRIRASLTSINFNRDFENSTMLTNVDISFKAMENFQDEEPMNYTDVGVTDNVFDIDINNLGARTDHQIYMIFGSGIVGTDNIKIEQDGYTLEINQPINDGDILVFDGIEKQVLYNGTPIDYDGPFVQLETGSNSIRVSINGTFIADITHLYYVNYL